MNDEVLNIKLTESEINLVMNALDLFGRAHDDDTGALELHDDLMEQVARHDDPEWSEPEDRSFSVTENDFIDHGIRAREMQKATSRAATRRNFNLKERDRRLSKTQTHDVWDANDPKNW
jgi:hypothetical protein